jgi:hypothetical protein
MKVGDVVLIEAVVLQTNENDTVVRVNHCGLTTQRQAYFVPTERVFPAPSGTLDLSTYTAQEGYYPHD